jgi:hypothetical protein
VVAQLVEALCYEVLGSIPDELMGLSNLPNHPSRIMALDSTQQLTEVSTRNIPWGKRAAGA